MIAIDSRKQQTLDADPKEMQQEFLLETEIEQKIQKSILLLKNRKKSF